MKQKLSYLMIVASLGMASNALAGGGSTDCEQEVQDLKSEVKDLKDVIKQLQGQPQVRKDCASVGQLSEEGTRCLSSTGIEFVRYRNTQTGALGWKDTGENGKIWYDLMAKNINQYDSEKFCTGKQGQALPSNEDFQTAETHGFREILKDSKDRWFWSSSVVPNSTDLAYYFDGSYGSIDVAGRSDGDSNGSARCVGR